MQRVLPSALRPGDTVGLVSTSSPVAASCPRRLRRAMAAIEDLGYHVRVAEHATARTGHTAGTAEQRAADLHAMFADPEIQAVMNTIGGLNSNQLLPLLDFDLIADNPKILVGYSDVTTVLHAVTSRTGLVTFYGPAALPQFGEYPAPMRFTVDAFQRVVGSPEPAGRLPTSRAWTGEILRWDEEDDRSRTMTPNRGPIAMRPGQAAGPLWAGNLGCLLLLAGTAWWPDLDGAILCVEDDEEETPGSLDRYFTHLAATGALDTIAGLLIGRLPPQVGIDDVTLEEIVTRTVPADIPVAYGLDFGHTDPLWTLPLGIESRLNVSGARAVELALAEPAVSPH